MERGAGLAVAVSALAKRYSGGIAALDGIDLELAQGAVTGILGANGSGKSTLVRILAGVVRPDAGSARVLGDEWARHPRALRARIGYVAQEAELDPEMTGAETLRLFSTLHGIAPASREHRLAVLAESFGLREHLPRLVGAYSGGLRQRLHVAVGFVNEPELMLLDEPMAMLDPQGQASLWQLARQAGGQGRSVIIVSHDPLDAERHCDTVVLLHRGRIAAVGAPQELVARHGTWMLEIALAQPRATSDETLAQCVAAAAAVAGQARMSGARLVVAIAAADSTAAHGARRALIERLESAGENVQSVRLDPPDLASVYFNLTAEAIGTPTAAGVQAARGGAAGGTGGGPGRGRRGV